MDIPKLQAHNTKLSLNCRGKLLVLSQPVVMGILNITPDSFFEGSRMGALDQLLAKAENMLAQGATFIDLGGYSTRPGAADIGVDDELNRVVPAVEHLHKYLPQAILSIDTFRAKVAKYGIEAGAHIINDISSGDDDTKMLDTVGNLGTTPYIMMHKRGTPQTMHQFAKYTNVTLDVLEYFNQKVAAAKQAGIIDLIIDPGFGFAKTIEQNYQLLRELSHFQITGLPLLVGVSRKKMIQQITQTDVKGALNGTTVVNTLALLNGAKILRVHDVKEAADCIKIVNATYGNI
jgi:dihydropteroate synthase